MMRETGAIVIGLLFTIAGPARAYDIFDEKTEYDQGEKTPFTEIFYSQMIVGAGELCGYELPAKADARQFALNVVVAAGCNETSFQYKSIAGLDRSFRDDDTVLMFGLDGTESEKQANLQRLEAGIPGYCDFVRDHIERTKLCIQSIARCDVDNWPIPELRR